MTFVVVRESTGEVVEPLTTVYSFRHEPATFLEATRARTPGKSGKVLVHWHDEIGFEYEYYDKVFGLAVVDVPKQPEGGVIK
jgi:hypothetical protein